MSEPDGAPTPAMMQARETAIRLLSDGYAYDLLTEAEFEWRLGQLSLTNTPAEVAALVSDLRTASPQPPASVTSGRVQARMDESALAAPEERIVAVMSESHREGSWRVPQRLRIFALMSSVRIDLRYAVIPLGCTIEVNAIMANVSFIVPPEMMVEFDVSSLMATTRNHATGPLTAGPWLPHLRVSGSAVMAEVRVREREFGR